MRSPASRQAQHQRSGMARLLSKTISRARTSKIPFRVGQVVIGDDPFNGRHLGAVAVIDPPYVGLRTAGDRAGCVFYDYRQLRYPE
jgi:hypothetical protein